jgi:GNAT superfamily N-acetyltransferase
LSVGPHRYWCLTGVPDPFLNVVFRTRLPSADADELIDATLAHFRARQVERCTWWAEPESVCPNLRAYLTSHGLKFEEGGTGMAVDLSALPAEVPHPVGLTIQPVEDEAALRSWAQVMRLGFRLPERGEQRLYELFAGLGGTGRLQSYLASLNGRPVGTAQVFLGAGVAGVYQVTCLPDARGQGIGAAVTLAPLREARHKGYCISILQASRLGYPVYRRLGFRDYGKLNVYLWENETTPPDVDGA